MKGWIPFCGALVLAARLALGAGDSEPLRHYGVALLANPQAEDDFAARFHAQGRPLFLIGDLAKGVSLGDIIRFRDKAVLIDAEVWQTMKSTGVLDGIRGAQVSALSAQSRSEVWKSRADLAEGREKTAYALGAEFIRVLEEYFGRVPERMELAFRFEGDRMVLLAPNEVLGALRFTAKNEKGKQAETPVRSQPRIISEAPRRAFLDQPFAWTVWAVDPGYPSGALSYTVTSKLPPGLSWDAERHALSGRPSRAGVFAIKVRAANAAQKSDELEFRLAVDRNQAPRILGEPDRALGPDGRWRFQPIIADPDHLNADLKVEAPDLPAGLAFDPETRAFAWSGSEEGLGRLRFRLKAVDPLGASAERAFDLTAPASEALAFRSALSTPALLQGQRSFYAPVAVGPGRSVRYAAAAEAGAVAFEDGRIPLATDAPGTHLLEVTAEDELGNSARQLVSYRVLPRSAALRQLSLAARDLGGANLYEASWRFGNMRVGALQAGRFRPSLPFFFLGFPLFTEAFAGKGELFLDVGGNAQGQSGLTYGGLLGRLQGGFGRMDGDPFAFRFGLHYQARQALLLMDGAEYKDNELGDKKREECLSALRNRTDRADSLMAGFLACDDGARALADAYSGGDNELFLLESSLWMRLGFGAYAGPFYRLEDHFHSKGEFDQSLGLGLARPFALGWFAADADLRLGYSPAAGGIRALFDIAFRFGRGG